MTRLPSDAFARYAAMGAGRSYARLAEDFGVAKRTVVKRATREKWAERLEEFERTVVQRSEERAVETVDSMNERHLKIARAVQGKALEALRSMPLATTRDILRALDLGLKHERLARAQGHPGSDQPPAVVIEISEARRPPGRGE